MRSAIQEALASTCRYELYVCPLNRKRGMTPQISCIRFLLMFSAISYLPRVLALDSVPSSNRTIVPSAIPGLAAYPITVDKMGDAPAQKQQQCLCALDDIPLETKLKNKPADPFNGNSALLFAYAKTLADMISEGIDIGDSQKSLYIAPPFYPGIIVEQPDPQPLVNYQLWQYADGLLPPNSPIWDHDSGSYFDFYSEYVGSIATFPVPILVLPHQKSAAEYLGWNRYLSYASTTSPSEPNTSARNNMLHLFGQLKAAAKEVDKAKADAIATYKQLAIQATGSGGALPPELQNLTVWLEENATYRVSQENLSEITELYNRARTEYYGPSVQEISDLLAKVALAKEYLKPVQGNYNMPCTSSAQSWADRLQEAQTGQPITTNSSGDLFYKPAYALDSDYIQTVDFWSSEYRENPKPRPIFSLYLNDLMNLQVDWESLGFPNIDNGRDESIPPKDTILSLQTKTQTLTPRVEEIVISATNVQVFGINRGDWDKPDFKLSFPKLRADAPIRLNSLIVRPLRFLFAYGVRIDLRINESDVEKFVYEFDQLGTGNATLLGVTRGLQVEGNTVSTPAEADPDPGYPYLLAVLGERL